MSPASPRVAPVPQDQCGEEIRAVLRKVMVSADRYLSGAPDAPALPNSVGLLMKQPRLGGAFLEYHKAMFANPSITPRQRELLILRVNWRTAGVYEWIFHSKTAMRYGITEEQVEAVSRGPADGAWSSIESALLSAADQMLDCYYIDDVTWSRLAEHFDDRQLIEIAFVIGTYAFLAMALNSLGLQLDPDLAPTAGQAVPTAVTLRRPRQIAPVGVSPRLKPPTVDQLDDEQRAVLREGIGESVDTYLSVGSDAPRLPNVLRLLMLHPGLTGNWLVYTDVLLRTSTVDPRLRELMILRVCWRTRALHEWLQYGQLARQVGVTPDEMAAIAQGADCDVWTPLEGVLLTATDQMLDQYCVDDATWTKLAEHFNDQQLMEITFVIGTYACLAMAFNSFGLELDPHLDLTDARFPEQNDRC